MPRTLRTHIVVIVSLLFLVSSQGCKQGGSDDDRPPVIISDGSVHIRTVAKTRGSGNQLRGDWQFDSGTKTWFQNQTTGAPGGHFFVNIIEGNKKNNGSSSDACGDPEENWDVKEFSVTYTSGGNDVTFNVLINAKNGQGKGRLAIDGPASPDGIPFWLTKGETGDRLKSVQIKGETCVLKPGRSEIHVYLRP